MKALLNQQWELTNEVILLSRNQHTDQQQQ